eukprot:GFUD01005633.1.p1 GENE.GFUD01005633.1~~GFUD01005633.1.p1  ORF type:complete len:338 (+),score=77.44 GFUD01005633.1:309-1322(+)
MADPPKVNSSPSKERAEYSELLMKMLTALFYGVSSFMIMVVNKRVLTVYSFPSFQVLGIGQMLATLFILSVGKSLKIITFPDLSTDTFRKIWPLPLMYLGNMVFGLGGTQHLSLPMMTVLRRFSILMTMIGEFYVLKVRPSTSIQLSVYLMIFGSLVAASNDLAFNLRGYTYVLLNDFFTAGNGVLMKKKLESKDLGKYGLMYYNSLFMLLPASIFAFQTGDLSRVYEFEGWSNHWFTFQFSLSCIFGFVLIFSTVLCTAHNSALTTTIIGCLKNILITYLGMFIGGDYKYSLINFLGLNLSVIGSLVYTKVTFSSKSRQSPPPLPVTSPCNGGEKS